jgi:hypothetical protein
MEKKTEAPVHDGLPELLSNDNMAQGAVYEMFNEALKRLAANVADPNTEPTQKRKILLSIDITADAEAEDSAIDRHNTV